MEKLNYTEKDMLVAMFEMMDKVISRLNVHDRIYETIDENKLFELAVKLGIDGDIRWE